MKDEIKEILEGIKVVIKHDGTLEFNAKELKILLDYITNLQEQLHQASLDIQELTEKDIGCPSWCDKLTNLQEEIHKKEAIYDNLAVDYRLSQEENERLKETIENLTTMTVNGDRTQIKNTAQYKLEIYKSRNEKYKKVINEIKEKIDDYFGYDYKNESQARLDTINEINHIIVDLYNGGDEE